MIGLTTTSPGTAAQRWINAARFLSCVCAAMICVTLALLVGCSKTSTTPPIAAERKLPGEPMIRVRIVRKTNQITLTAPTKVMIYAVDDPASKQLFSTKLTLRLSAGQWLTPSLKPLPRNSILAIEPLGPATLAVGDAHYPGTIRLVPETRDPRNTSPDHDQFDVVNHVRLEAYLPGVLDRELYDHWQPAAYLAQAIAARSYAISRIIDFGPGRHFDVESTTTSQAYGGHTALVVATRAVADTMGLVLTWNSQIIPAYFSSTCGGIGQSDADAFGSSLALTPMIPAHPRSWCASSKYYSWGPIKRPADKLALRIAAWGRARGLSIQYLDVIAAIRVSRTNSLGRPVEFEITDSKRRAYKLCGEDFRHACNYYSTALKLAAPSGRLLSSFVQVALDAPNKQVVFSDGHGFGHGVGLCQFGCEAMARAGYSPQHILNEYYHSAKIERAY